MRHSDASTRLTSGLPPVRWHLGKPMAPHNRSLTGPMRKGAWSMKSLSSLLLVSLGIGVAAPAAARPRVPATAGPGVGDGLVNLAGDAPLATGPVGPLGTWLGTGGVA